MTKLERPFTEEWDAAGHNVVGIRFDTPIPWPRWYGAPQISGGEAIADHMAVAMAPAREEDRAEFRARGLVDAAESAADKIDSIVDGMDAHNVQDALRQIRWEVEELRRSADWCGEIV